MVTIKKEKDIAGLRVSGKILASVLRALKDLAKEGVALIDLEMKARELIRAAGAKPAFLGYMPDGSDKPFPAAICASLNETVVHGIPTKRILKSGDVFKIDLGVNYRGYFTDAAVTVGIGKITGEARELIRATEEALRNAIKACRAGNHIGDIGFEIEKETKRRGFKVIRGLTGHGVGFAVHEDPTVYNYGRKGEGLVLKPGLVLALEPMLSAGSSDVIQNDDESFATQDGSLTAHFEHTVLITYGEPEILTL
ncbi:MAG: type I methionyl aminopeptidase [Candidatus Jorgensenbacteria bacterium]|nr:type I methionyl aminopeptidase [Candidatus Jorgensenbacteria bacterium]